ncbi:MAG: cytochrome c maturation protein CcmE [Acidobacteria bacterium]|nr:cytochrome c maturation protein CcmE [Acidobacteriota bacterium]MCY3966787.1 cytochrome c maturation protein CcmE [Acidobacteriota bacterium]
MSTEPTTQTKEQAPNRGNRRLLLLAAGAAVAIALSVLAFGDVGENLVYFWSPTELHEAGPEAVGASIRLGGLVEKGSVSRSEDGLTLAFTVTDGQSRVDVRTTAVPPAMFREGIGVVIEGTMREDGQFATSRLMVKHDNEYQAPDVNDNRSMAELIESMQFDL